MLSAAASIKPLAGALERDGHVIIHDFFDAAVCALLAGECHALHAAARLRPAAIGRAHLRAERADVRGDRTHWFDPDALTPAQASYWQPMQALRIELNRSLLLGLDELEAHYALYPPAARYARHRDRFCDDDARVLSSVLYLNPDWHAPDGGALRLYLPATSQTPHVDILPEAGTLALFLSAEFEHEVLPATRERLSIAGWFRRRT